MADVLRPLLACARRVRSESGLFHVFSLALILTAAGFGYLYVTTHRQQIDQKLASVGLPRPFALDYKVIAKQVSGKRCQLVLRAGSEVRAETVPCLIYRTVQIGDSLSR